MCGYTILIIYVILSLQSANYILQNSCTSDEVYHDLHNHHHHHVNTYDDNKDNDDNDDNATDRGENAASAPQ